MAKKKATKKKATKKAAAKKRGTKKSASEVLIVQSKFKEALKAHGLNVAADAMDGANNMLQWYVQQAAARAEANGRKTVRAHDFLI